MVDRERPSRGREAREWRTPVILVLAGWCVIGSLDFAQAMRGPSGFIVRRPPGTEGAVGMPLAGAEVVTTLRAMLDGARDPRPWLLVVPEEMNPFIQTYIRYQLSYVAYPRRVDVATPGDVQQLGGYGSVITPAGIAPPGGWRPTQVLNGFTRYEQARP